MRGLVRFLVVLVVLAVLAVVGDRVAAYAAGQETAKALGSAFGGHPEVTFGGFPFLTQWATGDYRQVTVTQPRATIAGTTLSDVRLTVNGVRTPGFLTDGTSITNTKARSAAVTGTVPYAELPLPAGIAAKRAGDTGNRLRLAGKVDLLGHKVPVHAVVVASLRGGDVRLKPTRVHVGGRFASDTVTKLVRRTLDLRVTPPGLPAGVTLTSMKVTDGGIAIGARGQDIGLPGS